MTATQIISRNMEITVNGINLKESQYLLSGMEAGNEDISICNNWYTAEGHVTGGNLGHDHDKISIKIFCKIMHKSITRSCLRSCIIA